MQTTFFSYLGGEHTEKKDHILIIEGNLCVRHPLVGSISRVSNICHSGRLQILTFESFVTAVNTSSGVFLSYRFP
jgi:hypothetical protein